MATAKKAVKKAVKKPAAKKAVAKKAAPAKKAAAKKVAVKKVAAKKPAVKKVAAKKPAVKKVAAKKPAAKKVAKKAVAKKAVAKKVAAKKPAAKKAAPKKPATPPSTAAAPCEDRAEPRRVVALPDRRPSLIRLSRLAVLKPPGLARRLFIEAVSQAGPSLALTVTARRHFSSARATMESVFSGRSRPCSVKSFASCSKSSSRYSAPP